MQTQISDIKNELKQLKNQVKDLFPDDLLDRVLDSIGLEQRRSPVRSAASGVGLFLAGVIIGGGVALLLAPKTGIEMRSTLEDKLDTIIDKVKHLRTKAEETVEKATSKSDKEKTTTGQTATPGTPGSFHS